MPVEIHFLQFSSGETLPEGSCYSFFDLNNGSVWADVRHALVQPIKGRPIARFKVREKRWQYRFGCFGKIRTVWEK